MAEAWGARLALRIARDIRPDAGPLPILGDNLPIIRYAAGLARTSRPEVHALLDPPLADMACLGQVPHWEAVRRRFNTAADAAATQGCIAAAQLAALGHTCRMELQNTWADPPTPILPLAAAPATPP